MNSFACASLSNSNFDNQPDASSHLGTATAGIITAGVAATCLLLLALVAWRRRRRGVAVMAPTSELAPDNAPTFTTNQAFSVGVVYEDISPETIIGASGKKSVELVAEKYVIPPVGEQQLYDVIEQTNSLAESGLGSRQSHQQPPRLRAQSYVAPATAQVDADEQGDTPGTCSICEILLCNWADNLPCT